MKVHITLVGGQPAPVYHGIVATQPDKVVFIYSESSRDAMEKVRSEIHMAEDKQEPLNTTDPQLIMSGLISWRRCIKTMRSRSIYQAD